MSTIIPLLSNVKVAAPCHASWADMEAVDGDLVHFCAGCKKNVYNLSAMTQAQAEGLLRKHEGHLCVRYYQRKDGTILTQNCPVGQAALRMQMIARSKQAAMAAAAMASLAAFGTAVSVQQNRPHIMGGAPLSSSRVEQATYGLDQSHSAVNQASVSPVHARAAFSEEDCLIPFWPDEGVSDSDTDDKRRISNSVNEETPAADRPEMTVTMGRRVAQPASEHSIVLHDTDTNVVMGSPMPTSLPDSTQAINDNSNSAPPK